MRAEPVVATGRDPTSDLQFLPVGLVGRSLRPLLVRPAGTLAAEVQQMRLVSDRSCIEAYP